MERPKDSIEIISQKAAEELSAILRDAITDYIENSEAMQIDTWLLGYLQKQLPEKTEEDIQHMTVAILETVRMHDSKISSMRAAVNNGIAAESWFAKDVLTSGSSGVQAKKVVECCNALTEISNSYEAQEDQDEIIDVEIIPAEEWEDDKWNSYRMKDALIETASEAGKVALKSAADDLYAKVVEQGVQSVLLDKSIITESMLYGVNSGLKTATAGALQIAANRNIIAQLPKDTHSGIIANIAGLAIENVRMLGMIGKGEIGFAEGLSMMKNNTVATIAGMFGQKQGASIGAAIGTVFGPAGTLVGGFVCGAVGKFAGTKIGNAVVTASKKVCSAAKTVVKSVVNTVKNVGSKIKSGLSRLFR